MNGDIAEWIALARQRDWRGAFDVLARHNPFPAIAGRICHHPCEAACNRAGFDESLAICKLERFVGDTAIAQGWGLEAPTVERNGHVAVVGGGPAGLSAAFQLRRRGWRVTLFEARAELGGLMRHGIPPYRLARSVLDAEIARIVALGVVVRCGESVSTPEDFERLRATHDAVFVAVGAARVKRLPALGDGLPGVMDGAAYLEACNAGRPPALGRHVVVIGGGSAAIDAARSARRAGHEVTILALESRAQMPAQREEVQEALEEGVSLIDGAMLGRGQRGVTRPAAGLPARALRARRRRPAVQRGAAGRGPLHPFQLRGRRRALLHRPGPGPGALRGRPARARRAARGGRTPGHGPRRRLGRWRRGQHGTLRHAGRGHGQAGGAGHPPPVARRGGAGRRRRGQRGGTEAVVPLAAIATWYHPKAPRVAEQVRLPSERHSAALEVQLGLDIEQALAEAGRCFSCGTCIHCDNCVVYCPDLAVNRVDGGYEVLADYCKGCGLCVRECPTGSMKMVEEKR